MAGAAEEPASDRGPANNSGSTAVAIGENEPIHKDAGALGTQNGKIIASAFSINSCQSHESNILPNEDDFVERQSASQNESRAYVILTRMVARGIYFLDVYRSTVRNIKPLQPDSVFLTRWKVVSDWLMLWNLLWLPLTLAWNAMFTTPAILAVTYIPDLLLLFHVSIPLFGKILWFSFSLQFQKNVALSFMTNEPNFFHTFPALFQLHATVAFTDPFGASIDSFAVIRRHYFIEQRGILDFLCALPLDLIPLGLFFAFPAPVNPNPFGYAEYNPYLLAWAYTRLLKLVPVVRLLRTFLGNLMSTDGGHNINLAVQRMLYNLITIIILGHISGCFFWCVSLS
jgi:hypothetical protein